MTSLEGDVSLVKRSLRKRLDRERASKIAGRNRSGYDSIERWRFVCDCGVLCLAVYIVASHNSDIPTLKKVCR